MSPLQFLASSRRARDPIGIALFLVMATYAGAALSLALWPDTATWWMSRFHLRSQSFGLWAATQPAPWMYNFENRVLISDRRLSRAELLDPPDDLRWRFVNHHSARLFTFLDARAHHLSGSSDKYYYLESRYRDAQVQCAYYLPLTEAHGMDTAVTDVRVLEGPR